MSDKQAIKINKKIEIPRLKLWIIWILLFLIPIFITKIAFDYFSTEYNYFFETDLLSEAFEKIRDYNSSIAPESFMEDQLINLQRLDSKLSYEKLKEKIDNILCAESFICIFFDETGNKIIDIKNKKNNIIKNLPFSFLKSNIKKLIEQKNSSYDNILKAKNQLGIALQQIFKTITPITISKEKVVRNFSINYEGELFFIYCEFEKPSNNNYGFIAIIRGKDFSFHKMLEKLHSSFPEIRIVFKEIDINKASKNPELFYSGIKHSPQGQFIVVPTNPRFIRHVLHGGSEKLNLKYGNLFPFIEYKIPLEKYFFLIKKWSKYLNLFGIIIILLSFIIFLHISLFGLNEDFSFKKKIMYLILIASLFPFTTFAISIFFINNYNRFMEKINIIQHTETELQLANIELENYITEIESKISQYSISISNLLSNPKLKPSELIEFLKLIGKDIPLSSEIIYLDKVPHNLESIFSENILGIKYDNRTSYGTLDEEKDAISKLIPSIIIKAANATYPSIIDEEERKSKNKITILKNESSISEINDWLMDKGNMNGDRKSNIPVWYIRNLIHNKDSAKTVSGLFTTKFETKPILAKFLPTSTLAKINFNEKIGNYNIDYAFIPLADSGSAPIWNGEGKISKEDKKTVIKNPYSETLNKKNRTIIKIRNISIPHLSVAVISQLETNKELVFIIIILTSILDLSLILYFANKLLDIMFVEPITMLASNANSIAIGGEDWNTEINSGDEFEDLNNKFKELIVGLKERNILKSYVSEDAFSDIEANNSQLKPGGEYINATIVFSAIKDYEKLSLSISPQESINILSKFLSVTEEITKKYNGSIDKIIGDTIMLVFRQNPNLSSHGLRASQAALELVDEANKHGYKLYTGIASGKVISGKIGSYSGKLDFTVIGNPVNSAARFKTESKNGSETTGIIISGTTIGLTKGKAKVKFLRRVFIKGKSRKYNIYELLSLRD